jgi:hypothetical protein
VRLYSGTVTEFSEDSAHNRIADRLPAGPKAGWKIGRQIGRCKTGSEPALSQTWRPVRRLSPYNSISIELPTTKTG